MEIKLPPDFKEFLKLLHSHKVRYLLIGGYAVVYYGYVRATNDIDIWVDRTPENAERVIAVLKEFGVGATESLADLLLKENQVIRLGVPPLRVEILTTISGVDFEHAYSNRVIDIMDGVEVKIINLDHLKINKRASGRLKDLADLEYLP